MVVKYTGAHGTHVTSFQFLQILKGWFIDLSHLAFDSRCLQIEALK